MGTMVAKFWEYTKAHQPARSKQVHCMACKVYLSKATKKQKKSDPTFLRVQQSGQEQTTWSPKVTAASPRGLAPPPCLTKLTLEGSCQLYPPFRLFPKVMISQENQSYEESKEETKTQSPLTLL